MLVALTIAMPAGAKSKSQPSACSLLSSSQAAIELGGAVVQANGDRSPTFCLYSRPRTKAHETLVSLTVIVHTNVARAQRLIDADSNVRVDGIPALWHVTPARYLSGDSGGSASAIKNNLLLLVAIRGVAVPKSTAVRTLSKILKGM